MTNRGSQWHQRWITLAVAVCVLSISFAAVAFSAKRHHKRALPKNSVGKKQLKKKAVSTAKIAPGAVKSRQIAKASVGSSDLMSGSVGSKELQSDSVGNGELQDGSVGASQMQPQSVGASALIDSSVNSRTVKDGSLQADDLAPGTIPAVPPAPPGPTGAQKAVDGPVGIPTTPTQIAALSSLPNGASIVLAKLWISAPTGDPVITCTLDSGGNQLDKVEVDTTIEQAPVSLQGAGELGGAVALMCSGTDATSSAMDVKLTSIGLATVDQQ